MPPAHRARRPLVARWAAGLAACALAAAAPLGWGTPTATEAVAAAQQDGTQQDDAAQDGSAQGSTALDEPHVVLDEVSPWVDEDGALTLTGRMVNPTAADFAPSTLSVVRSSSRMSMRDDVSRWTDRQPSSVLLVSSDQSTQPPESDPDDSASGTGGSGDADDGPALELAVLPESVAPGDQAEFTFTIPADEAVPNGSADSTWGAYGLGVSLAGTVNQAPVQHTAPAFTVWHPDPGIDPTRVTTVLPVTLDAASATGGPLLDAEVLERAADPEATGDHSGALDRVLTTADALPESVLAVDPRLLVSAAVALEVALPIDEAENSEGDSGGDSGGDADGGEAEAGAEAPAGDEAGNPAGDAENDPAGGSADDPADDSGDDAGGGDPASAVEDPTDLPTAPDEGAREAHPHLAAWYDDLVDLAEDHEIVALPWADTHLTALWHADMGDLATGALDERDLVSGLLGGRTDVLWPASGTVESDDLAAIADTGADTVILSDTQQPSLTSYTSSANSAITTDGSRPAVVDDASDGTDDAGGPQVLQTLIADSGLAESAAGHASADSATAPGQFLALSAAVTAERPYDSRSLLLTLPRTSAGSGLAAFADDLAEAPWLTDTSLDALMSTEPVARGPLVDPESQDGTGQDSAQDGTGSDGQDTGVQQPDPEGSRADAESGAQAQDAQTVLAGLEEQYTTGAAASHAFVDADEVRRDMARALLACTSAGVVDGGRTEDCAASATGWVNSLEAGVKPEPGSSVLLVTGEQAMIPVRVDNATDRAARVRLRVESPTPQLSTEVSEAVTLGPGEARSVDVPVRGLANADVRSKVTLLTVDGEALPQSTELLVRVRADWENTATIAIGSVLVIVLVVGLVATIRRGRRKIPKNQLEAAVARAQDS